ncbi:MAG: ribosomal protein S18-alanine N-acetyltransferase [Oscillospiraceae bacterium]|jgi:ribosomal-protein-alanine N-acetyltransferase|nr:ribosomal protein S18-alanine N-acetyltransferase [Oscillospiraceae bacterium]
MIRRATNDDIPEIHEIEVKNFSLPWSEESFRDSLMFDDTLFFVDEEEGKIAGFAVLRLFPDEAELYNIAVAEEYRRRGIADSLLSALTDECDGRGTERILLEVRQSNAPARALYKKHGFTVLGVRARYYDEPKEDAVIMEREKQKQ